MNIFDFNIHLPLQKHIQTNEVNDVINEDLHLNFSDLKISFQSHLHKIEHNAGGNIMLFNTKLFDSEKEEFEKFNYLVRSKFDLITYTALIDFRRADINAYLERIRSCNINFVMFNSYLQEIAENDFEKVLLVCKFAEENKIKICIDASYGTSKMYVFDNLKLACYIADHISKTPIVIIHSGGKRVLDAMLLAVEKQNVYLDTSFSLPYYINSSIEMDMAFAYKTIGTEKVLYGSDFPYLNSEKSYQIHLDFFHKYKFSSQDIEKIMYKNALYLLNNV